MADHNDSPTKVACKPCTGTGCDLDHYCRTCGGTGIALACNVPSLIGICGARVGRLDEGRTNEQTWGCLNGHRWTVQLRFMDAPAWTRLADTPAPVLA